MVMLIEGKWTYFSLALQRWFQIVAKSNEITDDDWNRLYELEDKEIKRREKYKLEDY